MPPNVVNSVLNRNRHTICRKKFCQVFFYLIVASLLVYFVNLTTKSRSVKIWPQTTSIPAQQQLLEKISGETEKKVISKWSRAAVHFVRDDLPPANFENIVKPVLHESPRLNLIPRFEYCMNKKQSPYLIILVFTSADAIAQRNAIRETFAFPNQSHTHHLKSRPWLWRTLFVMGFESRSLQVEIEEEHKLFGDIIQFTFQDSIHEGTRKFIGALTVLKNEPIFKLCRPRFLLRTTDDIYINQPAFIHWLEAKFPTASSLYLGNLVRNDEPIRDRRNPLFVSQEDYPYPLFPNFPREPLYLISYDVVELMAAAIPLIKPIAMEDAFVGVLAHRLGLKAVHNEHFAVLAASGNICQSLQVFFVARVAPLELLRMFRRSRNQGDLDECRNIRGFHSFRDL